jgi:hypothetical protein
MKKKGKGKGKGYCLAALASLATVFAACSGISPEHQATAVAVLSQLKDSGKISPEQYVALVDAISSSGGSDWWMIALEVLGSAMLAYFGVQIRRGPVATAAERVARKSA